MATFQVTPPEKFSFKPEEWCRWIRRFERFRVASELNKRDEESQVNTLVYSMGDEADDILQSFDLSETDRKKYKNVKDKFEGHFVIKRNVIFERARFNMRVQQEGESVDSFITDLYTLAEFCVFGELHDELIRDRIVVGIRDKNLSERLQLESDLTLSKAIHTVRQKEVVKKQQTLMNFKAFSAQQLVDAVKCAKPRDTSRGKGTNTESKYSEIGKNQSKKLFPERPWQEIGIDFFYSKGRDYLLIIDYFSRFIEVVVMQKSKKADAVISALKEAFARYGIPEKLRSDNGPPFDCAEFTHFAKQWDVELVTSSPRYPQSNGEVERAVQTIKNILKKEKELQKALLAYRTTPLRSGFSPAELLMGRKLRSAVPTFHKNLIPKWPDMDKLRENENIQRMQQKQHYNIKHRARLLPQLSAGTSVVIANYDEKGIVQKKTNSPRQYVVQTPTSTLRRNRVHLVPLPGTSESTQVTKDCPEVVPDTRTFEKEQYPLNVLSRPKRTIKPSLKVRENLENNI